MLTSWIWGKGRQKFFCTLLFFVISQLDYSVSCLHQLIFQSNRGHQGKSKSNIPPPQLLAVLQKSKEKPLWLCDLEMLANENECNMQRGRKSIDPGVRWRWTESCLVHCSAQWVCTNHNFNCKMRIIVVKSQFMLGSQWNAIVRF